MTISSIGSVATITPQTVTPAQADAAKSAESDKASSASTSSTPAPTVLTQGSGSSHHHKNAHHPLPGQPGHQVNKRA